VARTFYITTPIYYPSAKLHIGNAYTTIAADAIARYKRLLGYDVFFLTGTDEHGKKLQRTAERHGKTPLEYIEPIVAWIQDLWEKLDISYDDFIRTTEPRHKETVQKIIARLVEKGDIYLGRYEGYYCVECEAYWTEFQVVKKDGQYLCPDCGRPVQKISQESYFLRLTKYQDRLIRHIEEHPGFILPEARRNEMLNNFLRPGLEDLSVSRIDLDWGIPFPNDPKHVAYVWIDALANYITALGYMSDDPSRFERYWPADLHLVGKDIVRFHTIYWPILLMALDLPLPKTVFGHGWVLTPQGKMSKSKGNVIDPKDLIARYGSDAVRYYLLREIPFGQDGVFTVDSFLERVNGDLANDLGNLVSRTLALAEQFAEGRVPEPGPTEAQDAELRRRALALKEEIETHMDRYALHMALAAVIEFVHDVNRYLEESAPWTLAREGKERRLATVLYHALEGLRFVGIALRPFLPRTAEQILRRIAVYGDEERTGWSAMATFGVLPVGATVFKGDPLFPRRNVAEEVAYIDTLTGALRAEGASASAADERKAEETKNDTEGLLDISEFRKIELRVGEVVRAERIEKSEKLIRLEIDLGGEVRQIVGGLYPSYRPEDLVGRKVVVVTNLKPRRLMGYESQGMLLAAHAGERIVLLTLPLEVPNGATIS